jgi:hypothetical protein
VKTTQTTRGTILEQFHGTSSTNQEKAGVYVNYDGHVAWDLQKGTASCSKTSNAVVNDGQWHLVIVRWGYGGRNLSFFIDGIQQVIDASDCPNSNNGNADNVTVGAGQSYYGDSLPNTNFFNGQIDTVAAWNRYPSDAELLAMR